MALPPVCARWRAGPVSLLRPRPPALKDLRDTIVKLKGKLGDAREADTGESMVVGLGNQLRAVRVWDLEHVHRVVGDAVLDNVRVRLWSSMAQRATYVEESRNTKRVLTQFNLEDLCLGK